MRRDGARIVLDLSDRIVSVRVVSADDGLRVLHGGRTYSVALPDRAVEDGDAFDTTAHVVAPLPGRVVKVTVQAGDTVQRGATMVVLEAMKMELGVEAPRGGRIEEVAVSEGDRVAEGAVLVTYADAGSTDSRSDGKVKRDADRAAARPPP